MIFQRSSQRYNRKMFWFKESNIMDPSSILALIYIFVCYTELRLLTKLILLESEKYIAIAFGGITFSNDGYFSTSQYAVWCLGTFRMGLMSTQQTYDAHECLIFCGFGYELSFRRMWHF